MRKIAPILAAVVLAWPLILGAQSEDYYDLSFARLTYVQGDVIVERSNGLDSEEGTVNLALVEGDKLITRDGRVEISLGRRNSIRLDRRTELEFSKLPRRGDDLTRLYLLSGGLYLRVNTLEEEKNIEIHTADASYYILEEGLYRLEAGGDDGTEIAVFEGSIEAAGENGSQLIVDGEQLIAFNGRFGSATRFDYRRDDFGVFNEGRDSLDSQLASQRYLPSGLDEYEAELAENGSWFYERPYGYVWVPTAAYADWRPYYHGRWAWYPVCGWTWIPYETWGWCVYHYGRWHWRLDLGWYWIPNRSWGPAWVHWYNGYDYVGWCPLSWYDRPVVIVDNHFYDRYPGSNSPAANRALTVVRRNQLQDPHISKIALSRVEASGLGQVSLQARQPDIKAAITRSGQKGSPSANVGFPPRLRPATGTDSPPEIRSPSRITRTPSVPSSGQDLNSPRVSIDRPASAPRKIRVESGSSERQRPSNSGSGIRPPSRLPRGSLPGEMPTSLADPIKNRIKNLRPGAEGQSSGSSYRVSPWPPVPYPVDRLESTSTAYSPPASSSPQQGFSQPTPSISRPAPDFSSPSGSAQGSSRSPRSSSGLSTGPRSASPQASAPSRPSPGRIANRGK
jgi:hypothetical protein